ncbi:MAG: TlpA family protein disulfide reductase [Bacteroidia bacterium]
MLRKIFFLFILSFFYKNISAQYDAECFVKNKEAIKSEIDKLPLDSFHLDDTILVNGVKKYRDTIVLVSGRLRDLSLIINKVIGCKLPDFSYFDLNGEEMSVDKIKSEFTVVYFGMLSCVDVCNMYLDELSALKKTLNDSITIVNIYDEKDDRVREYSKTNSSWDNINFVANAAMISYNYSLPIGTQMFILDKYKNIIYIENGWNYNQTRTALYFKFLELIRSRHCSD